MLCAGAFAQDKAEEAAPSAEEMVSEGLFEQNFVIAAAEEDAPHLLYCGAKVREEFVEFEPDALVICSAFAGAEMPDALPKPEDCPLDWEGAFVLPKEGEAYVRWTCRGDTDFGTPVVKLADGQSLAGEGWGCKREGEGLLCQNAQGHGFTLSRKEQKVF